MAAGRGPGMGAPGMSGPAGPGMGGGAKPSLHMAFVSLKSRNFRMLWFSSLAAFVGMQMQMVASGWLAFELTGSFAIVGLVSIAWGIPMLLFSLLGGATADRMERRDLVLFSQLGTGVLGLATAILITAGVISIPILFVAGLLQGTIFAFNMPARQALIAELVPPRQLMNAIALNNAAMNGTRIVGPAVAGVMIGLWGVDSAYYAQTLMYLVTLGFVIQLPRSGAHLIDAETRGTVLAEIGVGLRYIAGQRTLLMLMLMAFVPTMLGMPYVMLLPGFAVEELGLPPGGYGFMLTISGIGALVGSLTVVTMTEFPRKALLQMGAGLGFGAGLAALGLATISFGYAGALVAIVILGLFSNMYMTLNNTMIMGETRPQFYGRIMSIYMLTFSIFPFMSYPLGVLADRITASTTFVLLGAAIIAFMALMFVVSPRFVFKRSVATLATAAGLPGDEQPVTQPAAPAARPPATAGAAAAVNGGSSARAAAASAPSTRPPAERSPTMSESPVPMPAADSTEASAQPVPVLAGGSSAASERPSRRDYMGGESSTPVRHYMSGDRVLPAGDSAPSPSTGRPGWTSGYGLRAAEEDEEEQAERPVPAARAYGLAGAPAGAAQADAGAASGREPPVGEDASAADAVSDPPPEHESADAPAPMSPAAGTGPTVDAPERAGPSDRTSYGFEPLEPVVEGGRASVAPAERVELPGPPQRRASVLERTVIASVTASLVTGLLSSLLRRRGGR